VGGVRGRGVLEMGRVGVAAHHVAVGGGQKDLDQGVLGEVLGGVLGALLGVGGEAGGVHRRTRRK